MINRKRNIRSRFFSLLLFIFFAHCTKEIVRVKNPVSDAEKNSFGVIGFGLYVHNPRHKDLLNLFSKDSGTVFRELGTRGVRFSEILLKDSKNNPKDIRPYPNEDPVTAEKFESTQYYEGKTGYLSPFYLLLSLDPTKEFLITEINYFYQINCGQNCRRIVFRNFPVDPSKSFRAFPIQTKAGEITFGGIVMAKVAPTTPEDPYGISDDTPSLTEIFSGNKVAVQLEPGEEYIKGMDSDSLKHFFYGTGGIVEKKNAEKLFYDILIQSYPNGYWKTIAEKKRAALGN
ncbi:plasminogen-binding receptor Lp30 [Leptospira adleri]|uniref:Lipoprotein n=1 Tax=Leptospira adleri TaxID=2023186 RepID=A0A2M9YN88_9LEPT|nr:hypothetical protein [Leptospira adleri]PJZ53015.1 hypothetical protein CH380_11375 [Leptospira adleri]PJZ62572.1 hypothetical protein CH376_07155 [Leptospira adleri]